MLTVKALADLAGISRRTLHHYDQIGVLTPTKVTPNGYRHYDENALLRLQQILFYRDLDLTLEEIKTILDDDSFDLQQALQTHRKRLVSEMNRIGRLVSTIDQTSKHINGESMMNNKKIFEGFSKEKQAAYQQEMENQWGEPVEQSAQAWNSYSEKKQQEIMAEGDAIYAEIVANMDTGKNSPEIRNLLTRWHQHLRYFYEPSIEVLEGLGTMYNEHPDFNAKFSALHPDLPNFLQESIAIYVDELETAWLEQELETLEETE